MEASVGSLPFFDHCAVLSGLMVLGICGFRGSVDHGDDNLGANDYTAFSHFLG
jgi:hypothetical protein